MLIESKAENLMVEALKRSGKPLTLEEIVELIHGQDSSILSGATPTKSLYSIIFRREAKRKQLKLKALFLISKERGRSLYSLIK